MLASADTWRATTRQVCLCFVCLVKTYVFEISFHKAHKALAIKASIEQMATMNLLRDILVDVIASLSVIISGGGV